MTSDQIKALTPYMGRNNKQWHNATGLWKTLKVAKESDQNLELLVRTALLGEKLFDYKHPQLANSKDTLGKNFKGQDFSSLSSFDKRSLLKAAFQTKVNPIIQLFLLTAVSRNLT